jgi:hypothetical protein
VQNAINEGLGGVFGEMANTFDFCSSKGGRAVHTGGNGLEMVACVVGWVGGAAWYNFGKRGLQAIQNAITEVLGGIFCEMAKIFDYAMTEVLGRMFGETRRNLASCSCTHQAKRQKT